jgi:1,2-phenylacetyl-CoA epoxidase PaaB subunit
VGFDFWPASPDIYTMAKRKRERKSVDWEVIRLTASPARFVGTVRAPDEETAREIAIEQFQIKSRQEQSLLIRRA